MQIVLGLLGGLGIGSLLASLVTHWITRRASIQDRWYQEQREAYLGLLQAIHDAAVAPSDEKAKAYALWQTRCDLFGSPDVARCARRIVETNDGPRSERDAAFRELLAAMRADLGGKNPSGGDN
ncbi:hypothetical protein NLM33_46970 (plasmid) [Bradyrhizobium sp. CCGUVB1N3]|uniref:hypothetical protein n=1 Tax=Bradyrhizobium sp. CCGUVB1N3 TaxID=2949629 RepID=UPI0020B1B197|nr:hypothetical protein [Bradyrhizobium sp. CCGUVB1N3]MCP3477687.1 hypothetical protein [Bradyrhizobium sp. CCGUVB1N3]